MLRRMELSHCLLASRRTDARPETWIEDVGQKYFRHWNVSRDQPSAGVVELTQSVMHYDSFLRNIFTLIIKSIITEFAGTFKYFFRSRGYSRGRFDKYQPICDSYYHNDAEHKTKQKLYSFRKTPAANESRWSNLFPRPNQPMTKPTTIRRMPPRHRPRINPTTFETPADWTPPVWNCIEALSQLRRSCNH